jgi:aspartyl-tRNA(Asn)/glutamyl-tRNA(Gln) amidotransferase subunit A
MTTNLHDLTLAEAGALIRDKKLSPVELTETLLARIKEFDSELNAFITVTEDKARSQALAAEQEIAKGNYKGPMHGIPIGLKDIYDAAGIPTTAHSKVYANYIPEKNATTVAKLFDAGAVLMGKLATQECANGGPSVDLPWPPARNPWHPDHNTGGSSSGSGAAVAAGMVMGATGTDTGGSIRNPAAMCGIAGIKPTYGRVSRFGVMPNTYCFDNCGPLAWTVEDCVLMLQALAGYDPLDPASSTELVPDFSTSLNQSIKGMRIGVLRYFWEEELPNEIVAANMEESLMVLQNLGAVLEDVRLHPLRNYTDVKLGTNAPEIFSVHRKNMVERLDDFGDHMVSRAIPACLMSSDDYVNAQRHRQQLLEAAKSVYEKCDILIAPGQPSGPAPRFDQYAFPTLDKDNFTTPFNVLGNPVVNICSGFADNGLPVSIQMIGKPFDELTAIKAAHAFEQATPWRDKRPALPLTVKPEPLPTESFPIPDISLNEEEQALVRMSAKRAGLTLNERQYKILCAVAESAWDLSARLRLDYEMGEEPANTFHLAPIS